MKTLKRIIYTDTHGARVELDADKTLDPSTVKPEHLQRLIVMGAIDGKEVKVATSTPEQIASTAMDLEAELKPEPETNSTNALGVLPESEPESESEHVANKRKK